MKIILLYLITSLTVLYSGDYFSIDSRPSYAFVDGYVFYPAEVANNFSDHCIDYGYEGSCWFMNSNDIYGATYLIKYEGCDGDICETGTTYRRATSCPSPLVEDNQICVEDTCSPLSDTVVNVPEELCSGSLTDWDGGYTGTMTYQQCDSTCYVLEAAPISCSEYTNPENIDIIKKDCDTDINNFDLQCIEGSLDPYTPTQISSSCTPKNKDYSAPCDAVYEEEKKICDDNNMQLAGYCHDDGVRVTEDTFHCEPKIPKCDGWHEKLDTQTNTCVCDEGYRLNGFNECSKDLFPDIPDENRTDEQKAQQTQADADSHIQSEEHNATLTTAKKTDDMSKLDEERNDILKGLRSDNNTSIGLLNDIKDLLSGDSKEDYTDNLSTPLDQQSYNENSMDFINNVKDSFVTIDADFQRLKTRIDEGFTVSSFNTGTQPVFTAVVFDKELRLDLCESFIVFRSIFYYIFTIFFLVIGLRLFFFGFTITSGY